jgi:hypothetical protein
MYLQYMQLLQKSQKNEGARVYFIDKGNHLCRRATDDGMTKLFAPCRLPSRWKHEAVFGGV